MVMTLTHHLKRQTHVVFPVFIAFVGGLFVPSCNWAAAQSHPTQHPVYEAEKPHPSTKVNQPNTWREQRAIEYPHGSNIAITIKRELTRQTVYPDVTAFYVVELDTPASLHFGDVVPPMHPQIKARHTHTEQDYYFVNFTEFRKSRYHFSINALETGSFTLSGAEFSYVNIDKNGKRYTQRIELPEFSLQSLPIPDDYQGYWLPSSSVVLKEKWSQSPETIQVGDVIVRTLELSIAERSKETFPSFSLPEIPGMSLYDQTTQYQQQGNVVTLLLSQTLVPRQRERLLIPAINLPWFNTQTNQLAYATTETRELLTDSPKAHKHEKTTLISDAHATSSSIPPLWLTRLTRGVDYLYETKWFTLLMMIMLILSTIYKAIPKFLVARDRKCPQQSVLYALDCAVKLDNKVRGYLLWRNLPSETKLALQPSIQSFLFIKLKNDEQTRRKIQQEIKRIHKNQNSKLSPIVPVVSALNKNSHIR